MMQERCRVWWGVMAELGKVRLLIDQHPILDLGGAFACRESELLVSEENAFHQMNHAASAIHH